MRDADNWTCRDLADLGEDPSVYIHYQGGLSYELDETLVDRLRALGVEHSYDRLDDILFPFVEPELKARLAHFRERGCQRHWKPMDREARQRILDETHVFDRRRLFFLRFAQLDLRRMDRAQPVYRVLLNKSRDEIEQYILAREQVLRPFDLRAYFFVAFDLYRHLHGMNPRIALECAGQEQMDDALLKSVCELDQDRELWRGFQRQAVLPLYLRRYLVIYFDYLQSSSDPRGNRHRFFFHHESARQHRPVSMSIQEALQLFHLDLHAYQDMSREQLNRLYRKRAKRVHPDHGGDHDQFIALTRAYNVLLRNHS
ncbi:MAG: hypothetical protein CSA34_06145 [Desulfobulbus propionicus]|nr:MAG: hypothetical protein CSA34_06145 [Desulfobulbus propionicus]